MKSPGQSKILHPYSTIDPATGNILEPVKSCAIVERALCMGMKLKILRSMPDGNWISSFDPLGFYIESFPIVSLWYYIIRDDINYYISGGAPTRMGATDQPKPLLTNK